MVCNVTPCSGLRGCSIGARLGGSSEFDHRTDRLAALHQREAFIDVLELELVGDQVVDVELAVHVPIDDPGHIGAAARAAEGRAFPLAPGDQLKRPRADLGAGLGHADDDAAAPTLVRAFQRLAY